MGALDTLGHGSTQHNTQEHRTLGHGSTQHAQTWEHTTRWAVQPAPTCGSGMRASREAESKWYCGYSSSCGEAASCPRPPPSTCATAAITPPGSHIRPCTCREGCGGRALGDGRETAAQCSGMNMPPLDAAGGQMTMSGAPIPAPSARTTPCKQQLILLPGSTNSLARPTEPLTWIERS